MNKLLEENASNISNSSEQSPSPLVKPEELKPSTEAKTSPEIPLAQSNANCSNVSLVNLFGEQIVSMEIDGTKRLCLAQISHTLLKDFSYNEIHNRRVALGITCIQCTPVQLEVLRRSGAMPISSRRCGMITFREAERLCKSFLCESYPPPIPENFQFRVFHACSWGCDGTFHPSRYNSSRAKCIRCDNCSVFFSPNKFIFHSHRESSTKYNPPDAANFNSWRRHIFLSADHSSDEQISHAWEDVKAMFNGGTRKRSSTNHISETGNPQIPANSSQVKASKLQMFSSNENPKKAGFSPLANMTISGKLKPTAGIATTTQTFAPVNLSAASKYSSFPSSFENMLKTSTFAPPVDERLSEFVVPQGGAMYNPMATAAALLGPAALMVPWLAHQPTGTTPGFPMIPAMVSNSTGDLRQLGVPFGQGQTRSTRDMEQAKVKSAIGKSVEATTHKADNFFATNPKNKVT